MGLRDCGSVGQAAKLKPGPGSHCGVEPTGSQGLLSKESPREAKGGVVCWLWNECRELGGAQVFFVYETTRSHSQRAAKIVFEWGGQ